MLKRVEYDEGDEKRRLECELVFRWRYHADQRALEELLKRFMPLIESMAAERFRTAQLDKGFIAATGVAPTSMI